MMQHRTGLKVANTELAVKRLLNTAKAMTEGEAVDAIDRAIANNWKAFFKPDRPNGRVDQSDSQKRMLDTLSKLDEDE